MLFLFLLVFTRTISVSIPPLASMVSYLAGKQYKVVSILNQTQNPHTYEIRPSDLKTAITSDLHIEVGGHIEGWGKRICEKHKNCLRLYDELIRENIKVTNPHIWLDFTLVPECAKIIEQRLEKTFPQDTIIFRKNLEQFLVRYNSLVRELKDSFKVYSGTKILLYHPSWNNFLEPLGLKVAGALVHHGEKEVSAGDFARWVQRIKAENIRLIIAENNMPSQICENLAKESGACFILLNPLFDGDFLISLKEQALLIKKGLECRK
ncbi:MAG: metal ABC transporter substrate-binding protein [bacterium]|nr:metal ABC transporter substrate-binding protein [bacterium]